MRAIPRSQEFRNGGVSFWFRDIGLPERRPALPGSADYDVCIVGAGYTGLWTAYYLKKAQPDLRVAVLEREFAGFGASGRNGGWLSAEFAGSRRPYGAEGDAAPGGRGTGRGRAGGAGGGGIGRIGKVGRAGAGAKAGTGGKGGKGGKGGMVALQRAMMDSVDEVIAVAAAEGIEADIVKGGMRLVATNPAQKARLITEVEELHTWGYWPEDLYLLDPHGEPRLQVDGAVAAAYSPHAARVHPAKLVVGLAAAVEALGVDIFEGTAVTEIQPRDGAVRPGAVTEGGTVRADHVIRATEGFTSTIQGWRREWLPMNSSMIVTEPLTEAMWDHIGWERHEVLGDQAHAYFYAQRTADGRIAIGGRGVPYRFGSARDDRGATPPQTIAELWRVLARLFPVASEVPVAHAWSGVLGVPRDWRPTVNLDQESGLGWAGGYVGNGVTTSNLAGRTLRDLILGRRTDLTQLPWVGHRVRGWEPEPLRWVGTHLVYGLYRGADRRESDRVSRTSRLAEIAGRIAGR
ncbi:NAD(P)/FAD-dependent oxidoreductase [Streptomonospora nanhaiensis]|uniref:Glycine/D-amino acid oxidase-like deaminating enzyme n=2 Tax=Streptomonospora nanhaiensis TaxID=1323731 RepID=A0A853BWJ4_9ACTN|nr:FAD-dependent oxidoreductase [Streptomonospora nanhaiensis]NYI98841.1 glycine/D-amino acid oxidase-like deaminating enzyme [Streptomonospora nanhaiensis]